MTTIFIVLITLSLSLIFLSPDCINSPGGHAIIVYKFKNETFEQARETCRLDRTVNGNSGEILTIIDEEYNKFIQEVFVYIILVTNYDNVVNPDILILVHSK